MRTKKYIWIILLAICTTGFAQTKKQLIIGDWTEVRREVRNSNIYSFGGTLNEPSIQMTFTSNDTVIVQNSASIDSIGKAKFLFVGDTMLATINGPYLRIYEIEQLDKNKLIVTFRIFRSHKGDNDAKMHFIRTTRYKSLSKQEINNLKAPTEKDILYLKRINELRKRTSQMKK